MPEQTSQVLVVEDDPVIRKLLVTIAREAGYVTSEVSNGTEALEMIDQGGYQLLILDLMLPDLSGQEVLEKLDPERGCSVIIVTAGDDRDLEKIDSRLVCDVVRKPFDIHHLTAVINRSFDNNPSGEATGMRSRLQLRRT
ncbi:MAG TPA: response regulator [Thermoanaerobaculia bacterium]|nr:response regulator [Thermoanaerobaculia bacterium]